MKKVFLASLTLFILGTACFAQDVPFTIEKGFIIVPAKVIKGVPVEVAISTGLHSSVVESAPYEKFKLNAGYTNDGPVSSGNDRAYLFMDIADVIVGNAKPTSLKMALSPQFGVGKKIGRDIFAVLGADFFKGKIVQFDFSRMVLRFLDKYSADESNAKSTVMKFKMDAAVDTPVNLAIPLPVVSEILFNGKSLRTLITTGVASPALISAGALKQLQLGPVPEKGKTAVGKIPLLKIYDIELKDVPALFFGKDAGFEQERASYDAVLGLGLLKNFILTFDFKEKIVTLERPVSQ
jgi:hypothetical protein